MEIKSACHLYKDVRIFCDNYKFYYFKDNKMIVDKDLQAIKRSIDGVPDRICVGQIYKVTSEYGSWVAMLAQVGPGYISAIIVEDNDLGNRCNHEPIYVKGGRNDISHEELNTIFGDYNQTIEYLPGYKVSLTGK